MVVGGQGAAGDQHPGGRQLSPAGDAGQLELAGLRVGRGGELAVAGARREGLDRRAVGQAVPMLLVDDPAAASRGAGWVASNSWLPPSDQTATWVGVTRSSTRAPGRTRRQGTQSWLAAKETSASLPTRRVCRSQTT